MQRKSVLGLVLGIVIILSGCETTGLSVREEGNNSFSSVLYTLLDNASEGPVQNSTIKKPIKVAIAQVGEASPNALLTKEFESSEYINEMIILPADFEGHTKYGPNAISPEQLQKRIIKMQQLAVNLGADYLFVFGGSIDTDSQYQWSSFLDLTIIGGFILPNQRIYMEGKGVGALLDARTGKPYLIVDSNSSREFAAPSFVSAGNVSKASVVMRDELVKELAKEFLQQLAKR